MRIPIVYMGYSPYPIRTPLVYMDHEQDHSVLNARGLVVYSKFAGFTHNISNTPCLWDTRTVFRMDMESTRRFIFWPLLKPSYKNHVFRAYQKFTRSWYRSSTRGLRDGGGNDASGCYRGHGSVLGEGKSWGCHQFPLRIY